MQEATEETAEQSALAALLDDPLGAVRIAKKELDRSPSDDKLLQIEEINPDEDQQAGANGAPPATEVPEPAAVTSSPADVDRLRERVSELESLLDKTSRSWEPATTVTSSPADVDRLRERVSELESLLDKTSRSWEKACSKVNQAQQRIDFLEGIVDSKSSVVSDASKEQAEAAEREQQLQEQIDELKASLDASRTRVNNAFQSRIASEHERDALKEELFAHKQQVADLKQQLEAASKRAAEDEEDYRDRIAASHRTSEEEQQKLQERIDELSSQVGKLQQEWSDKEAEVQKNTNLNDLVVEMAEQRKSDIETIAILTDKVALHEQWALQMQQQPHPHPHQPVRHLPAPVPVGVPPPILPHHLRQSPRLERPHQQLHLAAPPSTPQQPHHHHHQQQQQQAMVSPRLQQLQLHPEAVVHQHHRDPRPRYSPLLVKAAAVAAAVEQPAHLQQLQSPQAVQQLVQYPPPPAPLTPTLPPLSIDDGAAATTAAPHDWPEDSFRRVGDFGPPRGPRAYPPMPRRPINPALHENRAVPPMSEHAHNLPKTAHETNLFALCSYDSDMMLVARATKAMREAIYDHGTVHYEQRAETNKDIRVLRCAICEHTAVRVDIYEHFMSIDHMQEVRAARSGISRAAHAYWLQLLLPPPQRETRKRHASRALPGDASPPVYCIHLEE